jgi:CubicO group peptidase (beta-lactamase class C family)
VIIVHQGAIFYERYARGFDASMVHYTWSVSKTVTNALTGIAVRLGHLAIGDSICDHLGMSIPRQDHCNITVQNLLEFSSGLAWTETYEGQSNQASSVLAMLYGEGHDDMVNFILGHDTRAMPNTTYMYSSGDATLLAGVVDFAMRQHEDENYPWTYLFTPLGMDSAVFERDARNVFVGSSFFHATPRDMAKFGFFFLNDGCWDGRRILPEGWVHDSTSVSNVFRTGTLLDLGDDDEQGRQIWLNHPLPEQHITQPWPDVPEDAYAARGHWGQSITVVPSLDTVIVRVADDRDPPAGFFNGFVSRALAVVR